MSLTLPGCDKYSLHSPMTRATSRVYGIIALWRRQAGSWLGEGWERGRVVVGMWCLGGHGWIGDDMSVWYPPLGGCVECCSCVHCGEFKGDENEDGQPQH